jgi:hypothetical protein
MSIIGCDFHTRYSEKVEPPKGYEDAMDFVAATARHHKEKSSRIVYLADPTYTKPVISKPACACFRTRTLG